jgi:hypothetical protein
MMSMVLLAMVLPSCRAVDTRLPGDDTCVGGNNATGHDLCGCAVDGGTIQLSCAGGGGRGGKITAVVFAAIGTPTGACGHFARGKCDGDPTKAESAVRAACVGQSECALPCDIQHFNGGTDPCWGVVKHVAVQVSCSTPQPPAPPPPPAPAPPTPPTPPLRPGDVGCAVLPAGAPPAAISCPAGHVIASVTASYGDPLGACPSLLPSPSCEDVNPAGWGGNASFVVRTLCLGLTSCAVPTDPMLYGSEFPCSSHSKRRLGLTWRCSVSAPAPVAPMRKNLWGGVGFNVWNFLFKEAHDRSRAIVSRPFPS